MGKLTNVFVHVGVKRGVSCNYLPELPLIADSIAFEFLVHMMPKAPPS